MPFSLMLNATDLNAGVTPTIRVNHFRRGVDQQTRSNIVTFILNNSVQLTYRHRSSVN